jgi:hypothetical protein
MAIGATLCSSVKRLDEATLYLRQQFERSALSMWEMQFEAPRDATVAHIGAMTSASGPEACHDRMQELFRIDKACSVDSTDSRSGGWSVYAGCGYHQLRCESQAKLMRT